MPDKPGRPKVRPETKPINLRLSLDTIRYIAEIGTKTGENRTQVIERLVLEERSRMNAMF